MCFIKEYLSKSSDFRLAYTYGKRYEGSLITVFIRPNNLDGHRLGVTASRKLSPLAIQRNRAKRLLREVFRLVFPSLVELQISYDWVINAKRTLLKRKVSAPIIEFREIVACVQQDECDSSLLYET